jgi:DNA-binding NarL/FixJ family response regulator
MSDESWKGEHLIRNVKPVHVSSVQIKKFERDTVEKRRRKVKWLHGQGLTVKQIAQRIDVTQSTVRNDFVFLGLSANRKF